jgi:hypothetical protein
MENSKLRSSGVENVCVLIDFIYENGLVARLGEKVCFFFKKTDSHLGDGIRFERKN